MRSCRPGAKLVDVRTKPELHYVGRVPGSLAVEWQTYPGSQPNPEFLAELAAGGQPKDAPVMFLCRSGARSHSAAEAATQAGWQESLQRARRLRGRQGRRAAPQHRRRLAQGRPALGAELGRAPAHPADVGGQPAPRRRRRCGTRRTAGSRASRRSGSASGSRRTRRRRTPTEPDGEHRQVVRGEQARGSSTGRRRRRRPASAPRGRTRTRSPPGATGRTACRR